jgi:hypothetical protein
VADDEPADELLAARPTPIARVQWGDRVKVVGRLRANGVTFTAPLTGATCIWYFTQAQTWQKTRWSRQTVTQRQVSDVLLEDETGSALIRMRAAVFRLEDLKHDWSYEPPPPWDGRSTATTENVKAFMAAQGVEIRYQRPELIDRVLFPGVVPTRAVRYHETVLRDGDRVAVIGTASEALDPRARAGGFRHLPLRTVFGDASPIIVSDEPDACS